MAADKPTRPGTELHALLGLSPSAPQLAAFLSDLESSTSHPAPPPPEVKPYSDIVYLNYRHIGLSLSFAPSAGYRPSPTSSLDDIRREGDAGRLKCTGVDLYNHDAAARPPPRDKGKAPRQRAEDRWERFPAYPVLLPSPSSSASSSSPANPAPFPLDPTTTGSSLLSHLGEPTRKGGGSSSTPALGIWTEWTPLGVMVEWASSGLGAWDKGGESTWRCVSVFEPGGGGAKGGA
ncbi:hypothetical protein DMC30DRAFT_354437 [Rhodotorula diobovata]|uniref:Uncharacterized protein n=1 Tax=Rhodotorula diobovata TaxID=5288 RepID=A0A5C5FSC3_9BASI|nr:hypothetical protein DMC30DRAFT_354437 [Rhodotorula diobovata]